MNTHDHFDCCLTRTGTAGTGSAREVFSASGTLSTGCTAATNVAGNEVDSRAIYFVTGAAATAYQAAGTVNTWSFNLDIILAAQWQDGEAGTTAIADASRTKLCDIHYSAFAATGDSKTFVTKPTTAFPLKFNTKCTHIVSVPAGKGAPSVQLDSTTYMKW